MTWKRPTFSDINPANGTLSEAYKMLHGKYFNCEDQELVQVRRLCRIWCDDLDDMHGFYVAHPYAYRCKLQEMFLTGWDTANIERAFACDYGINIELGNQVFINRNVFILDAAPVKIGNHVKIGQNVNICTMNHAIDPDLRSKGFCKAEPITIEDDVWIGAGCTILPGVTIGYNSIISAGLVVKESVPPNVIVKATDYTVTYDKIRFNEAHRICRP